MRNDPLIFYTLMCLSLHDALFIDAEPEVQAYITRTLHISRGEGLFVMLKNILSPLM